jgi:hypothetical protein
MILCTYILFLNIKNCLCVLDKTHISVGVLLDNKPRYRNRKGEITTNVQSVYLQDMHFYLHFSWLRMLCFRQ